MGQKSHYTLFISVFISLFSFSITFPLHSLRSLDSKKVTNVDIPINSESADYHLTAFNDPSMFYCEKTMGPLGVNDICTLERSQMTFSKSMQVSGLSSEVYPVGDRLVFFKETLLYVYGLQTDFDRPRLQMLSAVSMTSKNDTVIVDKIHFDTVSQQVVALKGSKIVFYRLNGLTLEFKAEIKDLSLNEENFDSKKIYYFKDKYVIIFDKDTKKVSFYTINSDLSLSLQREIQDCQEVYVDSKYVFAFTQDKLKAFNGDEEMVVNFAYIVRAVRKSYSSGVLVYVENIPGNIEESAVYNIECFGKSGFRLEPLLNCPKNGQAIYLTSKTLFMVYENWVRAYPIIREKEFSQVFFFDFVFTDQIFGVLVSQGQEFLVMNGTKEDDVRLFVNERTSFTLECKKEKGNDIVEYTFQVRCISSKCDSSDGTAQRFANGSCAHSRQIRVYPQDESGTIGVALLVGLGFVAGIAITMGLGVFNCFGRPGRDSVKAHSPRDRRFFSRNRSMSTSMSLRRSPTGSKIIETTTTLHKGDESYVSEDTKENMSVSLNVTKKRSSQTIYETPRFISFASTSVAGHNDAHSHIGYTHVESSDVGNNETSDIRKSSTGEDVDITEEKERGNVKIEKLKLGDNRVVVRDPASFRKELASFRDMVITNVIPEEEQKDETDRNTEPKAEAKNEGKFSGKYQAFKDENALEDEAGDDDDDDMNVLGEINAEHNGSFSG